MKDFNVTASGRLLAVVSAETASQAIIQLAKRPGKGRLTYLQECGVMIRELDAREVVR